MLTRRGIVLAGLVAITTISCVADQETVTSVHLVGVADVGCQLCNSPASFGEIVALTIDGSGTLYVVDREEPHIRVFDTTGVAVWVGGSHGGGPGELNAPTHISIDATGEIRVIDVAARRLVWYNRRRGAPRSFQLPGTPVVIAHDQWRHDLYLGVVDFATMEIAVYKWPATDSAPTVLLPTLGFPRNADGRQSLFLSMAIGKDGRLAVGDGRTDYRVRFVNDARGVTSDVTRNVVRLPKTEEEISAEIGTFRGRVAQVVERAGRRPNGVKDPEIDPLRTFFRPNALRYDGRGRLWILTERGTVDSTVFDVFDVEGNFLTTVPLEGRSLKFGITGDYLATVQPTPLGSEHVTLWRIRQR